MDEREVLRTVPIFSELSDEDITSLARLASRKRYPKDTVVFFENEEDYRRGDAALNAMPAGDTPGSRTSVTRYNVAIRMQA